MAVQTPQGTAFIVGPGMLSLLAALFIGSIILGPVIVVRMKKWRRRRKRGKIDLSGGGPE